MFNLNKVECTMRRSVNSEIASLALCVTPAVQSERLLLRVWCKQMTVRFPANPCWRLINVMQYHLWLLDRTSCIATLQEYYFSYSCFCCGVTAFELNKKSSVLYDEQLMARYRRWALCVTPGVQSEQLLLRVWCKWRCAFQLANPCWRLIKPVPVIIDEIARPNFVHCDAPRILF